MHWSIPLKVVTAATMLAAGIWLAGMPYDNAPRTAAVSPDTVKVPSTPPAISAAQAMPDTVCAALKAMVIPVRGIQKEQLSDTFSDARSENRRHDAIDIMAPRGTPVVAATAGRVEKLFMSEAGGITAYVRSPDGRVIYYYAHLDRYAPGLGEGQQLLQGAAVGTVGSTGNANPDGPHLHFAITATSPEKQWWEDAEVLNPYPLLVGGRGEGAAMACM